MPRRPSARPKQKPTPPRHTGPRGLDARRRRFVEEYTTNGFRAPAAAKTAGYQGDAAALRSTAWRVLRHPDVKAAVDARLSEIGEDARLRGEAILSELANIGYGPDDPGTLTPRVRALELLGKHRKLFVDRQEVTGKDGGPLEVNVDDVRARVAAKLARLAPKPA